MLMLRIKTFGSRRLSDRLLTLSFVVLLLAGASFASSQESFSVQTVLYQGSAIGGTLIEHGLYREALLRAGKAGAGQEKNHERQSEKPVRKTPAPEGFDAQHKHSPCDLRDAGMADNLRSLDDASLSPLCEVLKLQ